MINAVLRVVGGKHADQRISLRRRKFLIGREQDCQLRPNSELVSRHHCVFTVDDYGVRLRDLGSTNGTFVNGDRIVKEIVLSEGDHVVVGNLELELLLSEAAPMESGNDVLSSEVSTVAAAASGDTVWEVPLTNAGEEKVDDGSRTQAMPAISAGDESAGEPTASIAVPEEQTTEQPAIAPPATPAAPEQQQVPGGDTAIATPGMLPPGMMPPGYGQVPGYPPQQMPMYGGMPGYGQVPGYPPQQMPMYGGMPGGYGYMPQQPSMPQQPMAHPPQEVPAPADDPDAEKFPEVNLPDPSATGANDESPAKGSGGSGGKKGDESTGAANDIIRQYMQRRPENS